MISVSISNMGFLFGSSEEDVDSKAIDTNGNVNNNIIIREANDTHSQMLIGEKLLIATYFLVAAEILKLGIHLYHSFKKTLKKKYTSSSNE